jgi:D-cysteine desulfhydrase
MSPLFTHYPLLAKKLPYVHLGEFPTSVHRLNALGAQWGAEQVYIKRDDLSARPYGGNKIRKLEFLLGETKLKGCQRVLTFGYAGSHQTLAAAVFARMLGLSSVSILLPQPNAESVRQNLLASRRCGAELHHCRHLLSCLFAAGWQLLRYKIKDGRFPKIIFPGGTSALGIVGYVNAAFELKQQIDAGDVPEPDFIYVPLGTAGTAVGLMLGLKAAHLKTRVVAVAVVPAEYSSKRRIKRLFRAANDFLCARDRSFPRFELVEEDLDIRREYLGGGYGVFTDAGRRAAEWLQTHEGIALDGTYSAKTFAALLDDLRQPAMRKKTLLFWNTYNSRELATTISADDFRQLPRSVHKYFEEETQPWIGVQKFVQPAGSGCYQKNSARQDAETPR